MEHRKFNIGDKVYVYRPPCLWAGEITKMNEYGAYVYTGGKVAPEMFSSFYQLFLLPRDLDVLVNEMEEDSVSIRNQSERLIRKFS